MQDTNRDTTGTDDRLPLEGVRVIDAGTLIAAPLAASLLADFGAEVVKIEHPEYGDGLRQLEPMKDEVPLWWKVTGRNKECVTLDLSTDEGARLFRELARDADVVTENYRPGTMEKWGLGYDALSEVNPELVMLRVSGYGQTGPDSDRPGFGRIASAKSGVTTLIGEEDGPPMTPGFPLADTVAGVFGALGVLIALYERERSGGQVVDLGLYEGLFRLLEFTAIEYDQTGTVSRRSGNDHSYVAPSSTYETADGEYLTITATTPSIWARLCAAMDKEGLVDNPRFETNERRVEHADEINGIVQGWVGAHTREELEDALAAHDVPYGFAYDVEDIFADDHYWAREMLVSVADEDLDDPVVQGVVPKLRETPGEVSHLGRKHGADTEAVYRRLCDLSDEDIERLRSEGIV
ncbi:CaiB/BaiF CoA transferase family protein [Halomicrobium salinisoli]|uniref:CaiB/BaiF CoA transferase family protein n=1 Tax=Halomicrobium salinisoli TaxID=2878391 RepID=UPI001CF05BA3|nr:CoA transferase [Halomicrobium salinisoli]